MGADGGALSDQLLIVERHAYAAGEAAGRAAVVVHDVVEPARPAEARGRVIEGEADQHRERTVVRVEVVWRGRQEDGGREALDLARQRGDAGALAVKKLMGEPLIGQPEEGHRILRNPEDRKCRQRLAPPARSPAEAIRRSDAPAMLDRALGPRVVLAVSRTDDADRGVRRRGMLQQTRGRERFVIGMRCQEQHAIRGPHLEPRLQLAASWRWNGVRPCSAARAQSTANRTVSAGSVRSS